MNLVHKFLIIISLFAFLNFFKIVNCQVCKLIVEKCDDQKDVCSEGCESMCHRNLGVCVTSKGIAYCHCFNKEPKKNLQKEFRNKFKLLRDEMVKEDKEELERLEKQLKLVADKEEETSSDENEKNKKNKDEDEKVKKGKSRKSSKNNEEL